MNFMIASCTMPRSVGHSKLTPLLTLIPNPATWPAQIATLKANRPTGLSDKTIDAIVEVIPAYLAWKAATGLTTTSVVVKAPVPAGQQYTVVFTGVRDKAFEEALQAKGHIVASAVTKKTTHVIHANGVATTTSTKLIKAQEMGVTLLSLSQAKTILGVN